ncbi:hypothetical protein Q4555_06950 [Octadecabacter sp. 1_MG-2023]|uniref:hypothetical protein n=1 Tax=unclassified Octadecabacter TaxID=196158 RepID=UPI001C08D77A|nr:MULTISPECIES: hypothetical protein [unclassified Octadecabacter]MBU2994311.1 hypothetical protein [Octadecabacter sp. B2R22]MDO6734400.1 hypothetical protein [Octadecabacter sp. 1_MG-2023]
MAYANTTINTPNGRPFLARPFVAIGNALSTLAEAVSMAQAATRVAEMSDRELEEAGMDRAEAIEAVFSVEPQR